MDFLLFVDTNLGHNFALPVSDSDTVLDLKKRIVLEYAQCFPEMGELNVIAIKTDLGGTSYRLSESIHVGKVFETTVGARSLHVDASSTCKPRQRHSERNPMILGNKNNGSLLLQSVPDIPCHPNRDGNSVGMNLDQNDDRISRRTKGIIGVSESCLVEPEKGIDVVRVQKDVDILHVNKGALAVNGQCESIEQDMKCRKRKDTEHRSDLPNISQSEIVFSSPIEKRRKRKKAKTFAESKSGIDKPQPLSENTLGSHREEKKHIALGDENNDSHLLQNVPDIPRHPNRDDNPVGVNLDQNVNRVSGSTKSIIDISESCLTETEKGIDAVSVQKEINISQMKNGPLAIHGQCVSTGQGKKCKERSDIEHMRDLPNVNQSEIISFSQIEKRCKMEKEKVSIKFNSDNNRPQTLSEKTSDMKSEGNVHDHTIDPVMREKNSELTQQNIYKERKKKKKSSKTAPVVAPPSSHEDNQNKCDSKIVLGHLSLNQTDDKPDVEKNVKNSFADENVVAKNTDHFVAAGKDVRGICMQSPTFTAERKKKKKKSSKTVPVVAFPLSHEDNQNKCDSKMVLGHLSLNKTGDNPGVEKNGKKSLPDENGVPKNTDHFVVSGKDNKETCMQSPALTAERKKKKKKSSKILPVVASSLSHEDNQNKCDSKSGLGPLSSNQIGDHPDVEKNVKKPSPYENGVPKNTDDFVAGEKDAGEICVQFPTLTAEFPSLKEKMTLICGESSKDLMNRNNTELILKSHPDTKIQLGDPDIPDFRAPTFSSQQISGYSGCSESNGLREDANSKIPLEAFSLGNNIKSERRTKKRNDRTSLLEVAKKGCTVSPEDREFQEESTTREKLIGRESEIRKMEKKSKSNRDVESSNSKETAPYVNGVHIPCESTHTIKETNFTGLQVNSHAKNYEKKTQIPVLSELGSQVLTNDKSHKIKRKESSSAMVLSKSDVNMVDGIASMSASRKVPGLSIFDHIDDDYPEDKNHGSKMQIHYSSSSSDSDADINETQKMDEHFNQTSIGSHGAEASEQISGDNKKILRNAIILSPIVIDPTNLDEGLHYYEVYGIDCKAPWRGPLFRVPITIIKPYIPNGQPPLALFSGVSFRPGHIFRNFIKVPLGATWAEATMRASNFDTSRLFFINTVQISPLERTIEWECVVTFSSPSFKSFNFPVRGGLTMELVISQFWSSGIGSQEVALVDFEVVFHGIELNVKNVVLDGSESPVRIDSKTLLCCEELIPSATLNKVRIPYRPVESKLSALLTDRDKLPCGKYINGLKLIYQFKLDEDAEIRPYIPLFNNRIYDTKFESQFYTIADSYKRIYATGDAYPNFTKLSKGVYKLQLYIRHENAILLEKMKQNVLFIERKLENKDSIQLNFFSQPDDSIMENGSLKNSVLLPGELQAFYVGPPSKEKIPKNCPSGSLLLGQISYGKIGPNKQSPPISYQISFIIPPPEFDMNKEKKASICNKSVSERLEEEVRDAKIRLLSSFKCSSEEDRLAWMKFAASLKIEYPSYTLLLSKILESLFSKDPDATNLLNHHDEIINAAKDVIENIDKDKLANYFSVRSDADDDEAEKIKEKMETMRDQLAEALYQKGLSLSEIEKAKVNLMTETSESRTDSALSVVTEISELFEENLNELKKWIDVKLPKYAMLLFIHERSNKRLGTALKILDNIILSDSNSSKKKLYELKISLLNEMGWNHAAVYELQWLQIRFPSCLPPF
ncbi:hypothetical protein ZOSMA_110G00250 [Zostera marina]|uniref:Uncharacterized protein n=1 Tax=Zostera marina TaxID=29655 RepID=A0A0K9Q3H6_ZOSMR|nr:hypothetical protein ZOSMA_110G00250 [Zostera marina]